MIWCQIEMCEEVGADDWLSYVWDYKIKGKYHVAQGNKGFLFSVARDCCAIGGQKCCAIGAGFALRRKRGKN